MHGTVAEMNTRSEANMLPAFGKMLAQTGGQQAMLRALADHHGTPLRLSLVAKAATAAGKLGDAEWMGENVDYRTMVDNFIASMSPASFFFRMLNDGAMKRVPLRSPVLAGTGAMLGAVVADGKPIPVQAASFLRLYLEPIQAAAIAPVTREVAQQTDGAAVELIGQELRTAIGRAVDAEVILRLVDSNTPTTSSTGTTPAAALADLGSLFAAVNTSGASRLYLVASVSVANQAATLADTAGNRTFPAMTPTGGSMCGVPVLVSDTLSSGEVFLFDAAGIAGNSGSIMLDVSETGSIQMDTAPTNDGTTGTGSTLVSLFQTSAVAIRSRTLFGVERCRSTAVAYLSGVNWTGAA